VINDFFLLNLDIIFDDSAVDMKFELCLVWIVNGLIYDDFVFIFGMICLVKDDDAFDWLANLLKFELCLEWILFILCILLLLSFPPKVNVGRIECSFIFLLLVLLLLLLLLSLNVTFEGFVFIIKLFLICGSITVTTLLLAFK
jgi:hypothetical protein